MVAHGGRFRVVHERLQAVATPSLELELRTTRPDIEWNEDSFYGEMNQRLDEAGSTLAAVLRRSKDCVAQRSLAAPARSRALHFNADPVDRTHVVLHSSFHVLESFFKPR